MKIAYPPEPDEVFFRALISLSTRNGKEKEKQTSEKEEEKKKKKGKNKHENEPYSKF